MAESQAAASQALKKLEDRLTCAICLRAATGGPNSKTASTKTRPTCRQPTLLPQDTGVAGLPPAFHIETLFEIQEAFERIKESQNIQCEKCTKSSRIATSFCRDCGKFICELCCDIHAQWKELSKHEVVNIKQLQVKELSHTQRPKSHTLYCSQHEGKELEFYCETCDELICLLCTVKNHKDH